MIQRWLDVEAALAVVEAELGIIPKTAAREIARKARVERLDLRAMRRDFDTSWNPVMPLVDALRRTLSPQSARWVHWGATSKNIMDTGTALQIRDTCAVVLAELDVLADVLAGLAHRHRDTVMAGRTHGQHALPITFGYKCAVWLDEVMRQRERLEASRPRVLVGEFGGAVGTLAALGRPGPARAGAAHEAPGPRGAPHPHQDRGGPLRRVLPRAGHGVRHPRARSRPEHLQPPGDRRGRGDRVRGGQGGQLGHAPQAQPGCLGLGGAARPVAPGTRGARPRVHPFASGRTTTGKARRPGPSLPRSACCWAPSSSC